MSSVFQTPEQAELEKEYIMMINDCIARESRMTQWESGFIQSLSEQIEHEEFIAFSQNQVIRLDEIWNKVTD